MSAEHLQMAGHRVRAALAERGSSFGTWVQTASPEACQAAAASGYDFVVIDAQHGAVELPNIAELVRATLSVGTSSPIVRVPSCAPEVIGRVLDAGAHGVLIPDLRSGEEAAAVAAAARYAPHGTRGACPTVAATGHGAVPWDRHQAWAEENITVWGLIETPEAVADIDAIVQSGLHALVLGPFDLSMAMGLRGQVDHPEVVEAMEKVLAAAASAGVDCVAVLFDTDPSRVRASAEEWMRRGCRIVTALSDRWCLTQGWTAALGELRNANQLDAMPRRRS